MFKKTFLILTAIAGLTTSTSAVSINLDPFNADFNALMTGIARDVAPTLRLGALSGDLQGDATIDHFSLTIPGVGFTVSDGLGKILQPKAYDWQFVLPLADLINDNLGNNNFFEKLMVYPGFKVGAGMALWNWDFQVTGFYFPQSLTTMAVGLVESDPDGTLHKLDPQFSFGNLGFQVRRTLLADSGWLSLVPAISLGAGYHYTFFDMGVTLSSLEDMGISAPSVGDNQTLDMSGTFAVATSSHVATVDLQVSKHLLIFTPYLKLSGAYQNSTFMGTTNLEAIVTDNGTPGDKQTIDATPEVNVSDFGFLVTSGLELNLFIVQFNINLVTDMSRAFVNSSDSSVGFDANALSLNTGFRISF